MIEYLFKNWVIIVIILYCLIAVLFSLGLTRHLLNNKSLEKGDAIPAFFAYAVLFPFVVAVMLLKKERK